MDTVMCRICGCVGKPKASGNTIGFSMIYQCTTCFGWFLFPEIHVNYNEAPWSQERIKTFGSVVERTRPYARNMKLFMEQRCGHEATDGISVLEIGCASGFLGAAMQELGVKYVGIDIDRAGIKCAGEHGIRAYELPAERASELQQRFDFLLAFDVFEHVDNPRQALSEFLKVLKPSGTAIICVPNPDGLMAWLRSYEIVNWLAKRILGNTRHIIRSIDGYWHNIAYSRESLLWLCRSLKLEPASISSISINDPVFGYVQPNGKLLYRLVEWIARQLKRDAQLLMIIKT